MRHRTGLFVLLITALAPAAPPAAPPELEALKKDLRNFVVEKRRQVEQD